ISSRKRCMKAMIKGEDLPRLHQAPPQHPKWMKIKKKMIHNLNKMCQRQHPKSKNKKSKNVPPQAQVTHDPPQQTSTHEPLVKHGRISKDHPMDLIIGSPSKGVRTRSKHASFCKYYSFVSCIEPTSIEEALGDSDWVMAMQEELNNFTRNEVWVLEAPLKDKNIIGTKWVFRNKQD